MFAVAASNVNGGLVSFFHGVQVAVMMALMTNILQFAYWKVKKRKGTHWQRKGPLWLIGFSSLLVLTQPVCMLVIGSWESMPNFFFDGGDMGAKCVQNSGCHSGMCDAGATGTTTLLTDYWQQAGCDVKNWDAVSTYVSPMTTAGDGSLMIGSDILAAFTKICTTTSDPLNGACNNAGVVPKPNCGKGTPAIAAGQTLATFDTSTCACSILKVPDAACDCTCAMDSNALVPNTGIGLFIQIFCTYGGFALMFTGVFQATNLHKKIAAQWRQLRKNF